MDKKIERQVRLVLEDDNEVMAVASGTGSDLDAENKRMNRELIKRHEEILDRIDKGERLTKEDLQLIRDANEIHLNDEDNIAGHYKEAVALNEWLDKMLKVVGGERAFDEEGKCLKCGSRVAFADVTDTMGILRIGTA